MKPKVLITGGLGFIGSHLTEQLTALNYELVILDNYSANGRKNLATKVKVYKAEISSQRAREIFKKIRPQVIVHLAADNRVTALPEEVLKSNVVGTYNILEAARLAKVKQVIFSSSAAVYGNPETLPIKESHPTKPLSAYGLSKLVDELYLNEFKRFFTTSVFRFANVYGPRQSSRSEGGVVSIFIDRLLKKEKPIVFGDGSQTRDFIFVGDVVRAIILAIEKPGNFTLNIGSNQPVAIKKLISEIGGLLKINPVFATKPFRPIEIKHSLFDCSLAKKTLGWQPKTKRIDGLYETINYFTGFKRG